MSTATETTGPPRDATRSRGAKRARTAARPRGAARREALLEATLALVAEVGADAVTHRRVAERAGLPLASTTYWFRSKEHLLTEALQHAADRDCGRLREDTAELLESAQPLTLADLIAFVPCPEDGDVSESRTATVAAYALMLEAARRPALQELQRRWTATYVETIGALLARLGSRRPADDARLLIAAGDGLLLDRLATGDDQFDPRPELLRLAERLIA